MKLSIVTISFNQAPFLRQCIESVLTQNYADVEYIVVDAGSTDGSRELIETYGDRVVRVFAKDAGPADGLNRGFSLATGDVFGFLNSDDYYLSGALAAVALEFQAAGLAHFVSGSGYIENKDGTRRRIYPTTMTKFRYLYGACNLFQPGTFFPRALFEAAGGFNPRNFTSWDGELFLNFLCMDYPHRVVRKDVAVFRLHGASITGSGRLADAARQDHRRMFREKLGRDPHLFDELLSLFLRILKFAGNLPRRLWPRT